MRARRRRWRERSAGRDARFPEWCDARVCAVHERDPRVVVALADTAATAHTIMMIAAPTARRRHERAPRDVTSAGIELDPDRRVTRTRVAFEPLLPILRQVWHV
jgi:hypothetical protein